MSIALRVLSQVSIALRVQVGAVHCSGDLIPQVRRCSNTEQYLLRWTCLSRLVQRTVFSAIRGSYADSTSTRTEMDMSVLDDRHQAHVSVVSEEVTRSRGPLWPALVIASAICATLLWAGTLLWLLSRMLLFLLA